mmetsp:Transcript_31421/g.121582  ORF Transcript_31421/g.121582 Transcript_31421/m.121582 type:complete len:118 (-) Transcript_31421:1424-1777(-)
MLTVSAPTGGGLGLIFFLFMYCKNWSGILRVIGNTGNGMDQSVSLELPPARSPNIRIPGKRKILLDSDKLTLQAPQRQASRGSFRIFGKERIAQCQLPFSCRSHWKPAALCPRPGHP